MALLAEGSGLRLRFTTLRASRCVFAFFVLSAASLFCHEEKTISSRGASRANSMSTAQPTDLPFKKGDVITILARDDEEWWKGRLRLREGMIPRNYVEAHFA